MQLYGIERHQQLPETDLKTYLCDRCGALEALLAPWPSGRQHRRHKGN